MDFFKSHNYVESNVYMHCPGTVSYIARQIENNHTSLFKETWPQSQ